MVKIYTSMSLVKLPQAPQLASQICAYNQLLIMANYWIHPPMIGDNLGSVDKATVIMICL